MSAVSVSSSEECATCDLKVKNGLSTAVIDLKLDGTRLTITPSIPMEFTFNNKNVSVNSLSLYSPCPIRIENIQYDAVITLNGNNGTFLLMIPIQASATPDNKSDSFLNRVVSHIPELQPKVASPGEKPTSPTSVSVPTGSDWSLTSILPLTGDAKGELTMQNPFFYWGVPYPGMDEIIERIDWINTYRRWLGQPPVPYPYTQDPRMKAILMAKPATAGAVVMSLIHLLPTTPVPTNTVPSKGVLYKPFICGEKKEEKKEKFENKECNPFSVPPTPPPISSETLITIILSVLGAIAGFIGVYFAVKYAAGPTGDIMKKIGEGLGKGLVAIKKSIPTAKIAVPAPTSAPASEAKKETPTLTPVQEKTAVKEEPEVEAAEKRLSSSLTQKNPFFQDKKAASVEPVKKNDKTVRNLDAYRSSKVKTTRRNPPPPIKRTATTPQEQADAAGTGLFGPGPTPADVAKEAQKELDTRTITPKNAPEGTKKRLIAVESERDLTPAMVEQAEKAEPAYPQLKVGGPLPNGDNRLVGNKKYNPASDETIASRRASREADKPKPGQRATTAKRVPQ